MIQFQNVSAGYAGRTVVREVSFIVPRGSVASLIGPNGQGKTTLLRTAGGLLKPQAGRVLLNGKPAGDYRRRELASLSGGERQRAYIAMALAQDSQVLLLDEPTTYLDVGQRYEVLELVRRLNAQGRTVLMVLHDLSLAFGYSDYVALVDRGELRAFGRARAVFESGAAEAAFGVKAACLPVEGKERYLFFH